MPGGHRIASDDPIKPSGSLVMVWNAGLQMWQAFAGSFDIPQQNPMDTWTRRVVDPIASEFKAQALFPFDSPPYPSFQQWAQRTEPILPSPIGALIHLMHGLWHAYRAEFIFDHRVDMPMIKTYYRPVKVVLINPALPHARWGRLSRIIIMCQLVSII